MNGKMANLLFSQGWWRSDCRRIEKKTNGKGHGKEVSPIYGYPASFERILLFLFLLLLLFLRVLCLDFITSLPTYSCVLLLLICGNYSPCWSHAFIPPGYDTRSWDVFQKTWAGRTPIKLWLALNWRTHLPCPPTQETRPSTTRLIFRMQLISTPERGSDVSNHGTNWVALLWEQLPMEFVSTNPISGMKLVGVTGQSRVFMCNLVQWHMYRYLFSAPKLFQSIFFIVSHQVHILLFSIHWFLASSGELSPWNDIIKRDKNKPIGEGGWVNYF